MQQQRWSRAEDAVIRRYKEQGAYKIRKQLRTLCGTDRTVQAIRMRASRKGVSLAKYNQCDVCGSKLAQQQRQMPRLQPYRQDREYPAAQTAPRIARTQGSEHRPKAHVQRRAPGGAANGEANRGKMIRKISRCLTCNLTVSVTGIHEPCTSL